MTGNLLKICISVPPATCGMAGARCDAPKFSGMAGRVFRATYQDCSSCTGKACFIINDDTRPGS
ncbi:hypothetical protein [Nguyenibacter sp. L1]|uniref:hypothetical protein n=1 Tax=Nguyenibacter sp. L1 TaxID=3049350 RepID=UPI002B499113|nr:hypothetical protein [Nguyenibacter sp. L1]WRH87415.1 hypothetical protein QN315_15785 [Nguyenibacter sp. L1]